MGIGPAVLGAGVERYPDRDLPDPEGPRRGARVSGFWWWTLEAVSVPSSPPPQSGRAERLRAAMARDGDECVWCRRSCVGLVAATTDHVVPRVKGGPSWVENEVVACRRCNAARGHTSPAEWFAECERRGWKPNLTAVLSALRGLDAAIAVRGGQRRARPYLVAQLRRLEC